MRESFECNNKPFRQLFNARFKLEETCSLPLLCENENQNIRGLLQFDEQTHPWAWGFSEKIGFILKTKQRETNTYKAYTWKIIVN